MHAKTSTSQFELEVAFFWCVLDMFSLESKGNNIPIHLGFQAVI